jgi:hypothetical protein
MVDYLVSKWYSSAGELEFVGGQPSNMLGTRLLRLVALAILKTLKITLSIITSIIGFSCLIILFVEFVGLLIPYIILGIVYLDSWLRTLHLGLHIFQN